MKQKSILNLLYLGGGSCALIVVGIIVGSNFINDGRIFAKDTAVVTPQQVVSIEPVKQEENTTEEYKTFKYKRTADQKEVVKNKVTPTVTHKPTPTPEPTLSPTSSPTITPTLKPKKVTIEITNYSGSKEFGKEVKLSLEELGYRVFLINEKSEEPVSTRIIDRSDKNLGSDIRDILNVGEIAKEEGESNFDATVILGNEFGP